MMNWLKGLILKKFNVFKHQNTFIRTKDKFPALVAGYGSGKTVAMCLKAILECGRNPNKIILLAEPVYPMINDVLQPTLENTLDELGFTYDYKASDMRYTVKWNGGQSYIILRSAENWRRWAGLNLACFGIDEGALLKDDSAWKMGISRLRDGKHLTGFTTTTPEGFNWVYEKWCENIKDGYILYNGKTTDNKYLPKEFVETLYDNYDKKLVEAYINGKFVNLTNQQAYYNFDRTKNISGKIKYDRSKPIILALDFNVSPMCGILLQRYEEEPKIRIIDEIKITHSGSSAGELMTERMAKIVKEKYPSIKYRDGDLFKKNPIDNYICYPDPAGSQRRTSAVHTDHSILKQNGFLVKVKRQAPRVVDRINSMNNAFKTLVIDPKCKELIKDLEQVVVKGNTRELDKSNPDLTHFSDALGYFCDYEMPCRKPDTKTFMA